jgi:hypothetical protein
MAESPSTANLFGRQGQGSSSSRYADDNVANALDPKQLAMFAIPTHATTHAPGASSEELPDAISESSSDVRLEGRPAPTPTKLDAQFHMLQTQMHLEAHHSVASSVQSSSSQYTVTAQQFVNRAKSVKQPQRALTQDTLRVEEAASSVANQASELPGYDRNVLHRSPDELPSALPGPGGPGSPGRFPRWRGWLEKRALERHLERLDIAATQGEMPVQRKKSWGAGVNDEDALSDVEDHEEVSQNCSLPNGDTLANVPLQSSMIRQL